MRVVIVSPYDLGRHGGVQDQVAKLAVWLTEAGHHAVVMGPGTSVPDGFDPERTVLLGHTVLVPANRSQAPISFDPRMRAVLRRAVAQAGAEVVHVHEPLMPVIGPAAILGLEVPTVATLHADPSPRVRRLYRSAAPAVRGFLRRAGSITAVSPVAASVLGAGLAVDIVPNGIDVGAYAAVATDPDPDSGTDFHGGGRRHRVVFLGRDEPRKGLGDLLAAWPEVTRRIADASLVVVGADASRHGSPGGVRFLGRLPEEDKRRVLAEADVLCAPNTGGESFGIILVEAMAAGCAVVATAIPGFVNVLGDAGVLVAPGDPIALGGALAGVLSDDGRLADLKRRAVERVWRFDREPVLAGYLAAYEKAVRRQKAVRL